MGFLSPLKQRNMWDDISWPFLWEWFEAALFINYFLFLVKHNKRSFRVQMSVGKVRNFCKDHYQ